MFIACFTWYKHLKLGCFMFLILLLLFTVIPALEIFLFIEVGGQIGAFNTFMIVIITGIVGAALAKSQGLQIIQKIQTELNAGKLPADQFFHGLLVFGGGLLLLTPGFITDILGICMVFPGTRHVILIFAKDLMMKGVQSGKVHVFTNSTNQNNPFSQQNTSFDESPLNQNKPENIDNVVEVDFTRKNEDD